MKEETLRTLTAEEAEKLRAKKQNEWAILHQADYILSPNDWETLKRLKEEVNALRAHIDKCKAKS